jgi:hypothetical protein
VLCHPFAEHFVPLRESLGHWGSALGARVYPRWGI